MDTNYLKEAFKSLSLLENDFDLSVDKDKVDELRSFIADDIDAIPEEPIIDTNAEEEHELQDNYVGKVILECECCHSRIYKEESDVIIDEESGLANIDEECPVCNNTLGYSVIGKIEPFDKEREIKPEEGEEAEEIPEEEVTDDIEVKESLSLSDRVARKHLKEEKVCPKCGKSPCVCEDCSKEKLDEELNKEELKKDVYNALAAVAYDYEVNKGETISRKDFEEAEEYFNNFFAYESEEDFDEALDTSDSLRADVYHALSEIGYRYFKKGIDVTEDDFKWAIDRFIDGYFHSMTQDDFEDMQMQMSPEDTVKDESLNEAGTLNTGNRTLITSDDIDDYTFEVGDTIIFDGFGSKIKFEFVGWDDKVLLLKPLTKAALKDAIEGEYYDEEDQVAFIDHDGLIDGWFAVVKPDGRKFEHKDPNDNAYDYEQPKKSKIEFITDKDRALEVVKKIVENPYSTKSNAEYSIAEMYKNIPILKVDYDDYHKFGDKETSRETMFYVTFLKDGGESGYYLSLRLPRIKEYIDSYIGTNESLTEDIAKDAGARIYYEYKVTEPAHDGNYGLADKDGNVTTYYGFSGGCAYIAALLRNNVNNIADDLPKIKGIMNHSVDDDRATFYIDSKDKNEIKAIGNEIASRFAQEGVELKVTSTDIGGRGKYSYINVHALSLPDEAFTNGLFQGYKVEFKKGNGRYGVREEPITEGIENLSLDTEDTHMEMTSDETGKVTVTTEPITEEEEVTDEVEDSIVDEPLDAEAGPEEIVPLDQEEMTDIEANSQEEGEQQLDTESEETIDQEPEAELTDEETEAEEETPDEEIEEFDEESFDEMGESFLRKVYSNVDKFSTTDATYNNGSLIVEGNIKFNSGKEKKTQFVFENRKVTKRGRTMLEGYNTTFSKNLKAFKLKGTLSEGKFTPESLFYNFKVNQLNEATNSNEVIKVCGKAKSSH